MTSSPSLNRAISHAKLQSTVDAKTFARGKAYFLDGTVGLLDEGDEALQADVEGTHCYHVRLSVNADDSLDHRCNCPVGLSGAFCKHTVAVALSWIENSGEEVFHHGDGVPKKSHRKRKTHAEQIQEYLETLDEASLREWLMEAVKRDDSLRDKLLFAAQAATTDDLAGMRAIIRQATQVSRPLDWQEASDYADRLTAVVNLLQ